MPIETGCVTRRRCDSRMLYESKIRLLTMSLSFCRGKMTQSHPLEAI